MQSASKEYKESMKYPYRNRGYIRVRIGVVNSRAQDNVVADESKNRFTYFSYPLKPFSGYTVDKVYATAEQDFTRVDGSMYFLPAKKEDATYNNGIITNELLGSIHIDFNGVMGLDIKGMTIDFGECYPVEFSVESDNGTKYYTDGKPYWYTEDVFYGTSYFKIIPHKMVNGQGRMRIYQFICGIANTFTNKEVMDYSLKDYVSSITDTIPSQDMSLTVDNQNLYYSVDNPDSALSFMEVGQEIKTSFGYDVVGKSNTEDIEWIAENTTYLKSWTANDVQAKFTATDRFDYLTATYHKGLYRESGISLYDLAIDVLHDSGLTDEREYFVDPYLKKVIVKNPLPKVKHSEALQIIANAGRCVLYEDRANKIHIQSSFVPDMEISVNNQTEYSHIEYVLKDDKKVAYALCSNDFSVVDESVFFMPSDKNYLNTGYISESIADTNGSFTAVPKITIHLEAAFVAFGFLIRFRSVAPKEFNVVTYYQDVKVQDLIVKDSELEYITQEELELFDKMEIVFTKGHPNARITVDNILIGDVTDYTLSNYAVKGSATGKRQNKIKSISVQRSIYQESAEEKELKTEEIVLLPNANDYTVYFTNPSYNLSVSIVENPLITCQIVESSNYYALLRFGGITEPRTAVKYSVKGKEYIVGNGVLKVLHNDNGEEKEWKNPLISTVEHAKDLEEWLASYFLGDVEYDINYLGDPRIDANDLFYLPLKNRETAMVRCFENTLKFKNSWDASMKVRKVVL